MSKENLRAQVSEMHFEELEYSTLIPKEYRGKRYILAIGDDKKIVAVYSVEHVKWFIVRKPHYIREVEKEHQILWCEYNEAGQACRVYDFDSN